jgi:hypothetical protein
LVLWHAFRVRKGEREKESFIRMMMRRRRTSRRSLVKDTLLYIRICGWSQIEELVRVEGLSHIGSKLENLFFRRIFSPFSKVSRARKMV